MYENNLPKGYLTAERLGSELSTSRVASQRLNHYTTRLRRGALLNDVNRTHLAPLHPINVAAKNIFSIINVLF